MKLYCSMAWISRQSATPVCHFINGWLKLWSMGQGGDTPTNSAASCRNKKKTCRKRTWKVGKVINWIQTLKQIYWFHGYKRERGKGNSTSNWIYAMNDKNQKQICKYTHTHTHMQGRLARRDFANAFFCFSNVSNFCNWLRRRQERDSTSEWLSAMYVCVCVGTCVCDWVSIAYVTLAARRVARR